MGLSSGAVPTNKNSKLESDAAYLMSEWVISKDCSNHLMIVQNTHERVSDIQRLTPPHQHHHHSHQMSCQQWSKSLQFSNHLQKLLSFALWESDLSSCMISCSHAAAELSIFQVNICRILKVNKMSTNQTLYQQRVSEDYVCPSRMNRIQLTWKKWLQKIAYSCSHLWHFATSCSHLWHFATWWWNDVGLNHHQV